MLRHDTMASYTNITSWLAVLAINFALCSAAGRCGMVTRVEWGARPPRSRSYITGAVSRIFIHHSAGNRCYSQWQCASVLRSIQNYHMNTKGWSDIGYSFLVGSDGRIYEGRGFSVQGAHTSGYNSRSYGISFMGNYMNYYPNEASKNAVRNFLCCMITGGYLAPNYIIKGHRDVKRTDCPGTYLYQQIQRLKCISRKTTTTTTTTTRRPPRPCTGWWWWRCRR